MAEVDLIVDWLQSVFILNYGIFRVSGINRCVLGDCDAVL